MFALVEGGDVILLLQCLVACTKRRGHKAEECRERILGGS